MYKINNNRPSFAVPVFKDKSGDSLYIQETDDNNRISRFNLFDNYDKKRMSVESLGHKMAYIGDDLIYAIALSDTRYWVGTRKEVEGDFISGKYRKHVEGHPFFGIEIGRLAENDEYIIHSAKQGAQKVGRISLRVAKFWLEGSDLPPSVLTAASQELDGIEKKGLGNDEPLVPIRLNVSAIFLNTIDSIAKLNGISRSELVRDKYRNFYKSGMKISANQKYTDLFLNIKSRYNLDGIFTSDKQFRMQFLEPEDQNQTYIGRSAYRQIERNFRNVRSTIRLSLSDYARTSQLSEEFVSRTSQFTGIEEFFGLMTIFVFESQNSGFADKYYSFRDRIETEVRQIIRKDSKNRSFP
jgi:hypothetical protein